ncbi:conserved protein, unknown function [Plasmodium ovale]|uniref:Helicase-associated domain-containing protein n=2 Tax=Plasmodium ovale TaxID=36330 RepID=A0A1A8X0R7_PLAOA|nr:conserved Plasmodium protein, unknown function [Plasmodium ovale curtisi]SBS97269.1 conserved Plasmodium protein, unknown function [Plasmodium ovale curtisi]SCP05910.1 conserved protein, unknown function [Plasmodium ovale]
MKNYVIYSRNEKKFLFEKFKRDIVDLLKIHNVFFIIGKLEFEEFIGLVFILYEKKFHILNEKSKLCVIFSDNILANCYRLIEDDLKDLFSISSVYYDTKEEEGDEGEEDNKEYILCRENKIIFLDESKLLQKILFDPLLMQFNIIILTNIHKRLTKTDLLLSLLKRILPKRNDLFIFLLSDFFVENVLNFFSSYSSVYRYDETTLFPKGHENDERVSEIVTSQQNVCKFGRAEEEKGTEENIRDRETFKLVMKNEQDHTEKREKNVEAIVWKNKTERGKLEKMNRSSRQVHRLKHDNEQKEKKRKKKHFSIENKKLMDIINEKNCYARSRSNTLSSAEDRKERNISKSDSENMVIPHSDVEYREYIYRKRGGDKDENEGKGDKEAKKGNVRNCLFVNVAEHSLIYGNKNEKDDVQFADSENTDKTKDKINKKLEEWKNFSEELEKVNNRISIFVFHICSNSTYSYDEEKWNNRDKSEKRGETEKRDKKEKKAEAENTIYYLKESCSNYLQTSIGLIKYLYEKKKKSSDNILIFLNNEYEIDIVKKGLQDKNIERNCIEIINDICPDDVDLIKLRNKIILAKDELFFSYKKIKRVKYIVDTCFMRDEIYDYDSNVTNKYTVLCNKSKCEERRLVCSNSICFRLVTMNDYMNLMNDYYIPEILKKDIFYNIFFLKTIGIKNICSYDFVTAPILKSLKRCFELFYILNLMDINGNIIDKKLSLLICYLPLKFKYSIFLLNSIKYKCVYEVAVIISMLINEPIFLYNNQNLHRLKIMRLSLMAEESDILSYYNIFQNFLQAKDKKGFCYDNFLIYKSLKKATKFFKKLENILVHKFGIHMESSHNIEYIFKAKISSFFYNVSKVVNDDKYKLLNGRSEHRLFYLDPLSILHETEHVKRKFIVYIDAYSNNESKIFMKHASIIDPIWLTNTCPSYFSNKHIKNTERMEL